MAEISILQLNIFQGKFLDRVIKFVKENDIDILHFQEVTAGKFSGGGEYTYPDPEHQKQAEQNTSANTKYAGLNIFEEVKRRLNYDGRYSARTILKGDHQSFNGNASFFKKSLILKEHTVVWLKELLEAENYNDINWRAAGYNALALEFEIGNKTLWTVNCHLVWGPTPVDEPYKLEINMPLVEYMKNLPSPWILTGDFNVDKRSLVVQELNKIGINLSEQNNFTNTLNERIHPAKNLFPPGLAVDFAYVSEDLKVKSCELLDTIDLSDHYGILTRIVI